jgi:transposase-like protein
MKGRYAGVSMRAHKATLPGVARLARLPAEPSTEAKRRLSIMKWYEEHGRNARLTARRFGFSPDTVSRWVRRYKQRGVPGLENVSRRPIHVRRPQTPPHVVQRILELREESPAVDVRSCTGTSSRKGSLSHLRASTVSSLVLRLAVY